MWGRLASDLAARRCKARHRFGRPAVDEARLAQGHIHALHAGHTYVEVGLTHVDRTHGRSKAVSIKNILKALRAIGQTWWAIHVRHELVARRA